MRLQKHTPRLGAFAAWNKCLSHLLALATAHIEWVIFQQFMLAVRRCKDSGCEGALKCMADIFALTVWPANSHYLIAGDRFIFHV
jgi:acyl-CoA oxidase